MPERKLLDGRERITQTLFGRILFLMQLDTSPILKEPASSKETTTELFSRMF
jgi:hypothetical protein